ncbi:hypothetical protein GGR39_001178 [Novosphingobium fluoreni]|uniref:DUF2292 domain-containing protein n=1 Tax=Novosphingobium fluoreni TaxID=1391222 RepID=A0A7W6C290_9SPHN|nr:YezD family protein [Novosphingobium fluoreni]MBB3939538.1 hypothetical protein [Novosphingobium fluoreni]
MGNATLTHDQNEQTQRIAPIAAPLSAVAEALGRLRYGAVHLTVHDGRVVQLDVTERQRFT